MSDTRTETYSAPSVAYVVATGATDLTGLTENKAGKACRMIHILVAGDMTITDVAGNTTGTMSMTAGVSHPLQATDVNLTSPTEILVYF